MFNAQPTGTVISRRCVREREREREIYQSVNVGHICPGQRAVCEGGRWGWEAGGEGGGGVYMHKGP